MVSIIAAMAEANRAIGWRGELPWRLPADLAHFRKLTMGHAVIMGRVTWEPIAARGLPGREVIVLTRGGPEAVPDSQRVRVASSLEAALQMAEPDPEIFIGGGASVYEQALAADVVDRMYLTLVEAEVAGDAFFPEFDRSRWSLIAAERRAADAENPFDMRFETYRRQRAGGASIDQESRTNDSAGTLR